jgi:hypothetical protein
MTDVYPLRFFNYDTKLRCSFLKVLMQGICLIVLSGAIDNRPLILEQLDWLIVFESHFRVVFPSLFLVFRIKNLRMKELFAIDSSEIFMNFELPIVQEASLSEALNEIVDAVKAVFGLSDHIGAKISHFIRIFSKTIW